MAERAARLAKADLVTEMVGEFPELQGLMGGYYARAEGLPDEVADAIRDHYKPVGQRDDVPTAPVTVAISLADKLDTLFSFFIIDEKPTGSRDPFALRRYGLAILRQQDAAAIRLPFSRVYLKVDGLVGETLARVQGRQLGIKNSTLSEQFIASLKTRRPMKRLDNMTYVWPDSPDGGTQYDGGLAGALDLIVKAYRSVDARRSGAFEFLIDRLKVQQREAGVRHDLIDAVFALGGEDDLVRLLLRVNALQKYMNTVEGANLLAAYKRASNILKKEDWQGDDTLEPHTGEEDPLALVDDPDMKAVVDARLGDQAKHAPLSYMPEPAEQALIDALDEAEPKARLAMEAEDFEGAMAALASLRAPIDRFFEEVTVNADEADKRAARLDLLARFRAAVHNVADFSRIEG